MVLKLVRRILRALNRRIHSMVRPFRMIRQKKLLQNRSLSLFSSNCVGCLMLHDLGVQYNSPFVNLFLNAKDFIKYLKNPQKYNALEFKEISAGESYPVGMLGDLTFHFVHYPSFAEAVSAFRRRVQRIDYENLFVILSERDGCTYEDLQEFDGLPYKNKVVFTHLPYEKIQSAFYIEGFETEDSLGNIITWDKIIGKRIYDRFDFVEWFNHG